MHFTHDDFLFCNFSIEWIEGFFKRCNFSCLWPLRSIREWQCIVYVNRCLRQTLLLRTNKTLKKSTFSRTFFISKFESKRTKLTLENQYNEYQSFKIKECRMNGIIFNRRFRTKNPSLLIMPLKDCLSIKRQYWKWPSRFNHCCKKLHRTFMRYRPTWLLHCCQKPWNLSPPPHSLKRHFYKVFKSLLLRGMCLSKNFSKCKMNLNRLSAISIEVLVSYQADFWYLF